MSIFDINLDAVEEVQDFGAAKPAPTRVRVSNIEEVVSKSGNPGLKISFDIVDTTGLEPLDGKSKVSSKLNDWVYLTSQALPFFRRFVESLGVSWESFKQNRDINQFKGMEADVMLGLNDDRTRNEIAKYLVQKVTA